MTYSEVKKKIKYWRDYGQYGGDTEKDMMRHIIRTEARAEAAEAALATAPVGAMKLVVWMLDDGPRDDVALAEVQRWIDARESRNRDHRRRTPRGDRPMDHRST